MIQSMHKGQTVKTVVVAGVEGTFPDSHAAAVVAAMEHAGETPERLVDWDTDEYETGTVTVRLYTA